MWLFALNMTWTHCEVYWGLDFEPGESQWRAADGIWGFRYLAWRLFFVLDFDSWSMGAKPGCPETPRFPDGINGSTRWVMYQGFVHLDAETREAGLHWSILFFVNLAPLLIIVDLIPDGSCKATCLQVSSMSQVQAELRLPHIQTSQSRGSAALRHTANCPSNVRCRRLQKIGRRCRTMNIPRSAAAASSSFKKSQTPDEVATTNGWEWRL